METSDWYTVVHTVLQVLKTIQSTTMPINILRQIGPECKSKCLWVETPKMNSLLL